MITTLLFSGNAENASQVRKRVLGIGFGSSGSASNDLMDASISNDGGSTSNDLMDPPVASPEPDTSISNDDTNPPVTLPEPIISISNDEFDAPVGSSELSGSSSNDDIDASTISDGMIEKTESKDKKKSKASTTKFLATKKSKLKATASKSPGAKQSKAPTTLKLTKEPSTVGNKKRRLGIGTVSLEPDSSTSDHNGDAPMVSGGMVQDGATNESTNTSNNTEVLIKFKASKSSKKKSSIKVSKAPVAGKLTKKAGSKKSKVSPDVQIEGKLDDGAIEFGSTEEPTSFSSFSSSFSSSSLNPVTFDPTSAPTFSEIPMTRSPTGPPTGPPTGSPTGSIIAEPVPNLTPVIPKSPKNTKAPEANKKTKSTGSPKTAKTPGVV